MRKYIVIGLYLLLSLIPLAYVWGGFYYGRGDVMPFWLSPDTYARGLFFWDSSQMGTLSNRVVLAPLLLLTFVLGKWLGLSVGYSQMFQYVLYGFFSLVYFNLFYHLVFYGKRGIRCSVGAVAASVLYVFNLFVLVRNFYPTVHWMMCLLPFFGYYLTLIARRAASSRDWFVFLSFGTIGVSLLTLNPPDLIIVFIFAAFVVLSERGLLKRGVIGALAVLIILALPALVANYFYIFSSSQQFNTVTDVISWSWTHKNSQILKIFLFKTSWAFDKKYYSFVDYFNSPTVVVVSMLIPLTAFVAVIFKRTKTRGTVLAYAAFLVVSILFAKGLNAPLIGFNELFYSLPYSFLFRESRKFMPLVSVAMLVLFAYTLDEFVPRLKLRVKIVGGVAVLVLLCVNLFPFVWKNFVLTGQNIDGLTSESIVKIPPYLDALKKDIQTIGADGSVLLLPYSVSYLVRHNDGLWAADQVEKRYIDADFITPPQGGYLASPATKRNIDLLYDDPCNPNLLDSLGIHVIVNRKYLTHYKNVVVPLEDSFFDKCDNLKLYHSTDDYSIFINQAPSLGNVFSFTTLYRLDQAGRPDPSVPADWPAADTFSFVNKELNSDFYFYPGDEKSSPGPSALFSDVFEKVSLNDLDFSNQSLSRTISADKNNKSVLYVNPGKAQIYARVLGTQLEFNVRASSVISANGGPVIGDTAGRAVSETVPIDADRDYYVAVGDKFFGLEKGKEFYVTTVGDKNSIAVYKVGNNVVSNASFESGFWQKKVGDCHNYDKNPIIAMSLNADEKTDGRRSLQLEATRHFACTSARITLGAPGDYVFSLDYQSPNSQKAGYYLAFNDAAKTAVSGPLTIGSTGWQALARRITVPVGATNGSLYLYAYQSDGKTNNIVRYDDVRFGRLEPVTNVQIPAGEFDKIPIDLKAGENTFEYRDERFDFANLLSNPSFEAGLWQEKVGDCHNHDKNPIIAMSLNADEKTDGRQSLQLEATRHIACTSTREAVKAGSTYLLSFDYQSPNAREVRYYISFNDSAKTAIDESLPLRGSSWQPFSRVIVAPPGASSFLLYVYAKSVNDKMNIINRYDNFKLIEVPDLRDAYYLVSEPERKLEEPRAVDFELVNPTKKTVHVTGATTPFFLAMSESYHDRWQLQLANGKISGWLNGWGPWAKPDRVADEYHYKLDGFLNAWYVDVDAWCAAGNNPACRRNADGSWDLDLVIEFWPQRWFYLGLLISGLTLAGCLGYLGSKGTQALRRRYGQKKTI